MKRDNWTVGPYAVRPAGKPDECFYCRSKIGDQHAQGCVIRTKTVVLTLQMSIAVEAPENWDNEDVLFHRNESSWCASNYQKEIEAYFEYIDREGCCACRNIRVTEVRDALEHDEREYGCFVQKSES